jgi:hypothetical protein
VDLAAQGSISLPLASHRPMMLRAAKRGVSQAARWRTAISADSGQWRRNASSLIVTRILVAQSPRYEMKARYCRFEGCVRFGSALCSKNNACECYGIMQRRILFDRGNFAYNASSSKSSSLSRYFIILRLIFEESTHVTKSSIFLAHVSNCLFHACSRYSPSDEICRIRDNICSDSHVTLLNELDRSLDMIRHT